MKQTGVKSGKPAKVRRTPSPGSDAAVRQGCTCPVLDNRHGQGSGWGKNAFWVNTDCPLHGKKA